MITHWSLTAGQVRRWAIVLLIPLAVNGLVWRFVATPLQGQLGTWRDAKALTELKPTIERLVAESRTIRTAWEPTRFTREDPTAPLQAVQQFAGRHHVDITSIKSSGQASPHGVGISVLPIEVEATGPYAKLARWMGELEAQYGFQMDAWTMVPGQDAGSPARLTLKLSAVLRGA